MSISRPHQIAPSGAGGRGAATQGALTTDTAKRAIEAIEVANKLLIFAAKGIEDDCTCATAFKGRHQDDLDCPVSVDLRRAAELLKAAPVDAAPRPTVEIALTDAVLMHAIEEAGPNQWESGMSVYNLRAANFPAMRAVLAAALAPTGAEKETRCTGRYPVPQTRPPRDEPFEATYRCALQQGHEGPCGC